MNKSRPFIVRSAVVLVLGLCAATTWRLPAQAQASQQKAYCVDAKRNGEAMPVPLKDYAVALLGGSALRLDRNSVIAQAVVLLKAPNSQYMREVYPVLGVDRYQFLSVQCQDAQLLETTLSNVVMETAKPSDASDLIARLQGLRDDSDLVRKAKGVSWPPFILLARNGFQPIRNPARYSDISWLVDDYQGLHGGEPAFLADIPYQVKLHSDIQYLNLVHPARGGTSAGSQASAGGQSSAPQDAAQQQTNSQRQTTQQQLAAAQQNRNRTGVARPTPQTVAPPGSVHLEPVDVTIRFRANQDQWQALLQPSRLDQDPKLFDTFDLCASPAPVSAGVYRMRCELRSDHKVPIHIRGFKELLLTTPDGSALDDQLEVSGFSYPYPRTWKRPQTEFIQIASGPLRGVLGQRIPLSQGAPGCQAEIAGLSIENIVAGTLPFPPEPCKTYDISFPQVPLSPTAVVMGGCIPGLADSSPIPIQNGKVTCWARNGQSEPSRIKAYLIDGFSPVDLPIAPGTIDTEFTFDKLAALLRPQWPYAGSIFEAGERPAYLPRSVTYVSDNAASCGGQIDPPVNGVFTLPTLSAAGCTQFPRKMAIAFEQDANAREGGIAPALAFKQRLDDTVDVATTSAGGRIIALDQLKVPLPVQFSADDARKFNAQFGTEAGNRQFPGVFLFRGNCTTKTEGTFVPFNGAAPQATYKWPIKAAVYDSGEEALTLCTTATVGGVQSGAPYLTFGLQGSRAVGPRRAIVISMSPNLASRGGVKALQESLRTFVDRISSDVAHGSRLSPINVFITNGSGDFRQLFSGEMAALDKDKVKSLLEQQQENVAPVTPDFRQLRFLPELRKDSNEYFDQVTFVMDGSEVPPDDVDFLAGLANRLHNPDAINLTITGNCQPWVQQNPNIKCTQLPSDVGQRTDVLVKAFVKFINPVDSQAMNSAPATEPPVQTRPVAPLANTPTPSAQKGAGGHPRQ